MNRSYLLRVILKQINVSESSLQFNLWYVIWMRLQLKQFYSSLPSMITLQYSWINLIQCLSLGRSILQSSNPQ